MLMNRYVLQMILVLFFATKSQLGAFIELISITFYRNIHHNQIFTYSILIIPTYSYWVMTYLALVVHSRTNSCSILSANSGTTNSEAH